MLRYTRVASYALSLCLLLAACGGGGGGGQLPVIPTVDPFFTCDAQNSGIIVRNESMDVDGLANTHHIVEIRVAVGLVTPASHTLVVDIAPGDSAMICTSPKVFVNDLHELFVKYDDGTNGCVRFEASPVVCLTTGNGSSTLYEVLPGEVEPFKVSYRGF